MGNPIFKTVGRSSIVTPLDLSRAVGIDPFSVPKKLEDHRPKDHVLNRGAALHPDQPTAAMQRPIIYGGNVPHSARILRIPTSDADAASKEGGFGASTNTGGTTERTLVGSTGTPSSPTKRKLMSYASPAEAAGGQLVVAKEVVPFLKPVILKYDKVLRQIFSHFAQTQARPVGSQGLFEEIAQWTTSLTHATFFKIMAHFLVVPKLMNKKHAFALLIGKKKKKTKRRPSRYSFAIDIACTNQSF